jgi:hypothetical protein
MLISLILFLRSRISCVADADGRTLVDDLDDDAGDSEPSTSDTSSLAAGDSSDRVETVDAAEDDFFDFDLCFLDNDDGLDDLCLTGVRSTESPSDESPDSSPVMGRDNIIQGRPLVRPSLSRTNSGNDHHCQEQNKDQHKFTYNRLREIQNLDL